MPYGLSVVLPPADEPVSLPEAKEQLRIDDDNSDRVLARHLKMARSYLERTWNLAFCTQSWLLTLEGFPLGYRDQPASNYQVQIASGTIRVPRPPLVSVSGIQFTDTTGTLQTLDPSIYQVATQAQPGRIVPAYGKIWPVNRWMPEAVGVTFIAGFGDPTSVPEEVKQAILLLAGHWFENREDTQFPLPQAITNGVEALMSSIWCGSLGGV